MSASGAPAGGSDTRRFLWVCILPVILFLIFVSLAPLVLALIDSLQQMSLSAISNYGAFIGLENFIAVLDSDSGLVNAVLMTMLFMAIVVPAEALLGMLLATVLNREFASRRVWVTILLLPTMIAPVAVGLMWDFLLMPNFGLFTYILEHLGLYKAPIFSDPTLAFLAIVVVDIWEWTPFMMLFMLAGLLGMPQEPIEAAEIDGASAWRVFWHVQLPLLRPMIVVAVMFRSIDASKVFETIYVLSGGGPGHATELISIHAFRVAFQNWELGEAAAICLLIALFSFLAASIFYKIISRQQEKESI
jgi:multiple sugar transport system permease protein